MIAFLRLVPLRFYAYGLVLVLVLGGVWYLHHAGVKSGEASGKALVDAYKAGQAQAVAEYQSKLEAAQKAATTVTEEGNTQVAASNEATHETIRTITKIVHDSPSPAICIAQPAGVRILTDAVRDANATASH